MMMTKEQQMILAKTERYIYETLKAETSGHDWWHIYRVLQLTRTLAGKEAVHVNRFVCEMAALLHDIADEKLNAHEKEGEEKVRNWLVENQVEEQDAQHILEIILHMSYKGGTNKVKLSTLEGCIVQDADRIDAMGAIGIARTMTYSGAHGRLIHDPNQLPREHLTLQEYRSGNDTAIMHFYEKLLKLKDQMNTQAGKEMAQKRHQYMVDYLEQFYKEWEGER